MPEGVWVHPETLDGWLATRLVSLLNDNRAFHYDSVIGHNAKAADQIVAQLSLLLNIDIVVKHMTNMPQQVTNDRLRRTTFGFYKFLVVVCPKAWTIMEKGKRLLKAPLPQGSSDSLVETYL